MVLPFHFLIGLVKVIHNFHMLLKKFVWCEKAHNMRCKVKWDDYCVHRNARNLNLMELKDVFNVFLCKWTIMAFKPRNSNFKLLFKYWMNRFQPSKYKSSVSNVHWLLVHNHIIATRSKMWKRIVKTWKSIFKCLQYCPWNLIDHIWSTMLW